MKFGGSGNLLRTLLPLSLEIANTHGSLALRLPPDDAAIEAVIAACTLQEQSLKSILASSGNAPTEDDAQDSAPMAADDTAPAANASSAASRADMPAKAAPEPVQAAVPTPAPSAAMPTAPLMPSFDCAKASSVVEKLICSVPALQPPTMNWPLNTNGCWPAQDQTPNQ